MANFGQDDGTKGAFSGRSTSIEAASAGNPALRSYLQSLEGDVDAIHSRLGTNRQLRPGTSVKAPDLANATLSVVDGKYVLDIIPPAVTGAAVTRKQANQRFDSDNLQQVQQRFTAAGPYLLHQIQTSTTTLFDLAGTVATYGGNNGDPALHWEIHDPNTSKYVRFRSRFSNSTWNAWQYLAPTGVCGAQSVYSGVLRSLANNVVNQANTYNGTSPLTQVGVTKQIAVAASFWTYGDLTVNFSSGSVTPSAFGTYYIYADDPRKAGGVVTYVATQTPSDLTGNDGRVYFGVITTAGGGGGTGSGGGSGGGCSVGDAEVKLPDGSSMRWDMVRKGQEVMGGDGQPDWVESISLLAARPCFRIEMADGSAHRGISSDGRLQRPSGEWSLVFSLLEGEPLRTAKGNSEITKKSYLGLRTVYKVVLRNSRVMLVDGFYEHNKAPL